MCLFWVLACVYYIPYTKESRAAGGFELILRTAVAAMRLRMVGIVDSHGS